MILLAALLGGTACSTATSGGRGAPTLPHTAADVSFMSGMIAHHAQAVVMSGWAASHGARADVQVLAARIAVAQQDEIALMEQWLRDRGEPVPDQVAGHAHHLMPGMLTQAELAQLENARGTAFDRLFLTFMIRHHEGALTMVDDLFESYGAAQDEVVFRFASDAFADQSTEIDRMQQMIDSLPRL
ncbi:MAG: DUF305 domain-containing protein [Gemmatimonadota bacterium]